MRGMYELSASASNVKKLVEEKLRKQAVEASFFASLEGTAEGSIVQIKTELEKSEGASVTHTLLKELKGEGVEGDEELEGKEEGAETAEFTTSLQLYRHATKVKGGLTWQYDSFNMPQQSQELLKRWMTRKIDTLRFAALYANHTNNIYGGDATSVATLEAADKLTPTLLRKIRVMAETGKNGAFEPLVPYMYKGEWYFFLVTHPEVIYDLKEDATMQQYLINSLPRDIRENPAFTGAEMIFDGIVLKPNRSRVFISNKGGSGSVPYAKSLLLGGGALLWSWGERPKIIPQVRDYGRIKSFAIEMIAHADKPQFDSVDFGSMCVITSRTQVS